MQPWPSLMKTGVPPTALNARTGDETPPGMTLQAFSKALSELARERGVLSGMVWFPGGNLKMPLRFEQPGERPAPYF